MKRNFKKFHKKRSISPQKFTCANIFRIYGIFFIFVSTDWPSLHNTAGVPVGAYVRLHFFLASTCAETAQSFILSCYNLIKDIHDDRMSSGAPEPRYYKLAFAVIKLCSSETIESEIVQIVDSFDQPQLCTHFFLIHFPFFSINTSLVDFSKLFFFSLFSFTFYFIVSSFFNVYFYRQRKNTGL